MPPEHTPTYYLLVLQSTGRATSGPQGPFSLGLSAGVTGSIVDLTI